MTNGTGGGKHGHGRTNKATPKAAKAKKLVATAGAPKGGMKK